MRYGFGVNLVWCSRSSCKCWSGVFWEDRLASLGLSKNLLLRSIVFTPSVLLGCFLQKIKQVMLLVLLIYATKYRRTQVDSELIRSFWGRLPSQTRITFMTVCTKDSFSSVPNLQALFKWQIGHFTWHFLFWPNPYIGDTRGRIVIDIAGISVLCRETKAWEMISKAWAEMATQIPGDAASNRANLSIETARKGHSLQCIRLF